MDIRRINNRVSVSPQIDPGDVTELARLGFKGIINNRPDGEEAGQPDGAAIRTVAETLGLRYTSIPVTQAGFSHPQIEAMTTAIEEAGGPVLAYCRSGTRSSNLWALAEARGGRAPDEIVDAGAGAGYDLKGLKPMLDALSGKQ